MAAQVWELDARANDGSANNLENGTWGQALTPLLRGNDSALYGPDGVGPNLSDGPRQYPVDVNGSSPGGTSLGDVDHVNLILEVVRTTETNLNDAGLNELSAFYGQFVTHDIAASAIPVGPIVPGERLFPDHAGFNDPLNIVRTPFVDVDGVREQVNGVTSHLDLSQVYGSNDAVANALRDGAKLIVGANGGLPTAQEIEDVHPGQGSLFVLGPGPLDTALAAGDGRAGQQFALASIQTVWLKEHNFWVDELSSKYPELTDDQLYNTARTMAEAEYQSTLYREYLGAIIGKENVPTWYGYDETVNDGTGNLFTTAAFRFGHDQQSEVLTIRDASGNVVESVTLAQAFLQTQAKLQTEEGLAGVLQGLQFQQAQEIEGKLVPSLIDNVLNIPGLNLNLGLLDNVRAADHGIGTLNQVRDQLGLAKYGSFADLTSDTAIQDLLVEFYGHVDNVDPWLGMLLEPKAQGSQLGETATMVIAGQFAAYQAGDRFYYEERLKDFPELIAEMKGVTFAEISDRNSGTDHSHLDSFHLANRMELSGGKDVKWGADDATYLKADLMIGKEGNDKLYGRDGNDTLYGDQGNDHLDGGKGGDFLKCGAGNDTANGGAGDDYAWGEDGNDVIMLDGGNDWADGGWGNDKINAGDGNDIALGKEGNDHIDGGKGYDELFGGDGKDGVSGGAGDDKCYGGAGDDCVSGGTGNDLIVGEAGNDLLSGGWGWDIFAFDTGSGRDKITDFNVKQDKIDLSALDLEWADLTVTSKRGTTTIDFGDTDGDGYSDTIALVGVSSKWLQEAIIFEPLPDELPVV